jgi:hypothetical protein
MAKVVESKPVEASMASFIVWLARQHQPLSVRTQCPREVELFLCWQRDQRKQECVASVDAYLSERRTRGASDGEINIASDAISHFQRYLSAED